MLIETLINTGAMSITCVLHAPASSRMMPRTSHQAFRVGEQLEATTGLLPCLRQSGNPRQLARQSGRPRQ